MPTLMLVSRLALAVAGLLAPARSRSKRRSSDPPEPAPASTGGGTPGRGEREPTVSVIVPTLNEEASLPWVLENLPGWVTEVVLVDGLSTDATEAVARRMRPDIVVVHQHTPGKGAALRAGFAAASGEIVVMIDADGSTDPREMGQFVDALRDGGELVKGSRHLKSGGSADFTRLRSAGNRVFVLLANLLFRLRFTDLCYGYCAFWRQHLEAMALTADGFEIETELVLSAVKAGLDIREVPSFELARRAGASNLNALRDGARVLRTMLRERRGDQVGCSPAGPAIGLIELEVPIAALPVDQERRRGDRRRGDHRVAGYRGPERRRVNRRAAPATGRALRVVAMHESPRGS